MTSKDSTISGYVLSKSSEYSQTYIKKAGSESQAIQGGGLVTWTGLQSQPFVHWYQLEELEKGIRKPS